MYVPYFAEQPSQKNMPTPQAEGHARQISHCDS